MADKKKQDAAAETQEPEQVPAETEAEHKPVPLGGQVPVPAPTDPDKARAWAQNNRAMAIAAVLEAKGAVDKIEGDLPLIAGDDAVAGAHTTLRTVASILGGEATALGG